MPPRKKTPEEQQREERAFRFTREREKRAQQLFQQGVSEKEARQEASRSIREQRALGQGVADIPRTAEEVRDEQEVREDLASQVGVIPGQDQLIFEEKPDLLERTASFGLTPAAAIGNLGGKGANLLAGAFGQEPVFTPQSPEDLAKTGFGKALGTATAATAAVLGVKLGAGLLASKSAALGVSAKGVLSAVGLTAAGTIGKINIDKRQQVAITKQNFRDSKRQMTNIVNAMNAGTIDRFQALELYNAEVQNLNTYERSLKELANQDVRFFISSGAGDELAAVTNYKTKSVPFMNAEMVRAIRAPDPNSVLLQEQEPLGQQNI